MPVYSGPPLIRTPLGQEGMSLLEGCPHFRGWNVPSTVFEDRNSVLFIEASCSLCVLFKGVPLYITYMYMHISTMLMYTYVYVYVYVVLLTGACNIKNVFAITITMYM